MAPTTALNALQLGQLLMVETKSEVLVGNLKLLDLKYNIIELDNVRDFTTNYIYTSSQILPLPQIKTIQLIETTTEGTDETETSTRSTISSVEGSSLLATSASVSPLTNIHCKVKDFATASTPKAATAHNNDSCSISFNSRELELLQEHSNNIVYIYQTDQLYHKALADIRTQSVVSLLLDPMEYGRHSRTSLLAVGTQRSVYIFDILTLGKIFSELKKILESKRPRKALHYGHRIVDNLKRRQNVTLAGVFDTFVAHCLLSDTKKTHLDLIETVQYYFNISSMYFEENSHIATASITEPVDPYARPITKHHLQSLGRKTIFQYKLYEHLLHEQMLCNFYQQCEQFSNTFDSNDNDVEVVLQMNKHSRKGFEHIRPQQEAWRQFIDKEL